MTITRAQLEAELVSRSQGYLETVEMAVSSDGANADLNAPIGFAVRQCNGTVVDPSLVADSDISGFEDADFDKLADIAEYRLLLNIKRRWGKVDIKVGQLSESLSQFADQLDKDIAALKNANMQAYGLGMPTLTAGFINTSLVEHDDDE